MKQKIKNALISVSDKTELNSILKILKKFKINIISSGGTFASIKKLGYDCVEISKFTGFNEMLNGRVKTLHPKIHAGILYDRSSKKHKIEMNNQKFLPIDLIIVNFYPFQNAVLDSKNPENIIENINEEIIIGINNIRVSNIISLKIFNFSKPRILRTRF